MKTKAEGEKEQHSLAVVFKVHQAHALVVHDLPVGRSHLLSLFIHLNSSLVLPQENQRPPHLPYKVQRVPKCEEV